jgi:alpha-L-rhamnosidase
MVTNYYRSLIGRTLLIGVGLIGILSGLRAGDPSHHQSVGSLLRNAMIWHPDDQSKSVSFRKQFRYAGGAKTAALYIFADSKYMLWINGQYVMRGPCRFDPIRPEYDSFEVSKYLLAGENTIAVQAYGHISTGETMEHTPGLAVCILVGGGVTGSRLLLTDTSWRCSHSTRYGDPTVWWDGIRENINAAKEDGDWTLPSYHDKAWSLSARRNGDKWGDFHPRTTPMPVATELPWTMNGKKLPLLVTGKTELFLKLKKNIVGYCIFEFDADSGARFNVFGHHYTARAGKQEYITGGFYGSGVTNTFGTLIRDEPDSVGIPVHIDTGSIRFTSIRVFNFIAPLKLIGSFHSSDTVLDRFWNVIANMHAQVTKDTYTDGVSEGNEWVGDVHNISQFTRVAFAGPAKDGSLVYADKRYLAKALSDIGCSQQKDGRIKAHHPSDRFDLHWFIEDFACVWIGDIRSYFEMTNDRELIRRLWPIVKKQMYWFNDSINASGILHGREWCVFDNPFAYKRGEGATLNAFVYKAFMDAAYLAGVCSDDKTAAAFISIASELKKAFNTNFWDAGKGTFRGMTDSAVTTHAAVMSLYTGICNEEHKRLVEDWLLTRSVDTNIVYPLLHLYWFRDLYEMNSDKADQQVLNIIRTKYYNKWNALNKGYVTSEGCNRNRNFHNFGMAPGYFLSAYVLGVRTEGTISDRRILIEPRLGDLGHADGTVVTEYGPVNVSWRRDDETFFFHCRIPGGVTTRLGIPIAPGAGDSVRINTEGLTLIMDGETLVKAGKPLKPGIVMTARFIYVDKVRAGTHSGKLYAPRRNLLLEVK